MRTAGALVLVLLPLPLLAGDWPQWRGRDRDGVWHETGLPERFGTEQLKPRWKQPLGGGYSGIAVAGGKVWTMDRQSMPREVERVLCLDAATGQTVWMHEYPVRYNKLDHGNGPRATPTVRDGRVWTYGAVGHLHCLDAATGKVIWQRDAIKEFQGRLPEWGHSCSPLLDGDRVVVQIGGEPNACLVAFDRSTGKEVWRSLPDRPGYSSPVLIETKAGRQLVYWAAEHLVGLEPAKGKVIWQVAHTTSYDVTITDPVWHDGILLVSDYWKGSKAIRLDDQGKNPEIVWQGRTLSMLMSTPLCHDGHVYALDRHNGLKCIELQTGKVRWEGEHVTPKGRNPQASLVWVGDPRQGKALIFNEKGELALAKLTPKGYEPLSKTAVTGFTWAHPAYADGHIFARTDREVLCAPLKPAH